MAYDLLNEIIRATERLTAAELEMLLNVARRQKEEAEARTDDDSLCLAQDQDVLELAIKKI